MLYRSPHLNIEKSIWVVAVRIGFALAEVGSIWGGGGGHNSNRTTNGPLGYFVSVNTTYLIDAYAIMDSVNILIDFPQLPVIIPVCEPDCSGPLYEAFPYSSLCT